MTRLIGKLVRDNVPAIIEAEGKRCEVEVLSPLDYIAELRRKVLEEAKEVASACSDAETERELADLIEAMTALQHALKIADAALKRTFETLRTERGAFTRRLFLRAIID